MKFKLISVGTKFEFENEVYIKTSPLIASNLKTGNNKLIPRYAELKVLDETGLTSQKVKEDLHEPKKVLEDFNHFYEVCINILDDRKILLPEIKDELDKARDNFTQNLIQ